MNHSGHFPSQSAVFGTKTMLSRPLASLIASGALAACALSQDNSPGHDPAAHAGAGLKKELIAGITEADFLKWGSKPNTVNITLVATFTDANNGMNFNGYSHGNAMYTIPVGWTVEVTFINPSPVPHSAILVEREMLKKVQVGEPAFKGASIPNPITGIGAGKATFTFTASEPGEYGLACGIPTHSMGGHWIAVNVSADLKTPTLKLGDNPAREPSQANGGKSP
jgi:sulfocyanin